MIGHPWLQMGSIRLERRTIGHPTLLIKLLGVDQAALVRVLTGDILAGHIIRDHGLPTCRRTAGLHRATGLGRAAWLYERAIAPVYESSVADVIVRHVARLRRHIAGW